MTDHEIRAALAREARRDLTRREAAKRTEALTQGERRRLDRDFQAAADAARRVSSRSRSGQ